MATEVEMTIKEGDFLITLSFVNKRIEEQQQYLEVTWADASLPIDRFKERIESATVVLNKFIALKEKFKKLHNTENL